MIDVDYFKALNDSLGHTHGDECLIRVASELKSQVRRAGDLVARFGGEEFVILLPLMGAAQAAALAESARRGIAELGLPHPGSPFGVVTASFGVAVAELDLFHEAQTLVQAADRALYGAKRDGRNRVCAAGWEAAADAAPPSAPVTPIGR